MVGVAVVVAILDVAYGDGVGFLAALVVDVAVVLVVVMVAGVFCRVSCGQCCGFHFSFVLVVDGLLTPSPP